VQSSEIGAGVFAEHGSQSMKELKNYLKKSILSMKERRKGKFDIEESHFRGIKCNNLPVCAIVAAVFHFERW